MTEDEARTKWCPFSRLYDAELNSTYNRIMRVKDSPHAPRCIASECMAWRESSYWGPTGDRIADGYCGLAGKND